MSAPFLELPQPIYRYFTKPPKTLRVSLTTLLTHVPFDWVRDESWHPATEIELPCGEIFESSIPRISVERLRSLIPQIVHIPEEIAPNSKIPLPIVPMALAYRLLVEQEEVVLPASESSLNSKPSVQQAITSVSPPPAAPANPFRKPALFQEIQRQPSTVEENAPSETPIRWFQKKSRSRTSQPIHPEESSSHITQEPKEDESGRMLDDPTTGFSGMEQSALFSSLPTFIPSSTVPTQAPQELTTVALPCLDKPSLNAHETPPIFRKLAPLPAHEIADQNLEEQRSTLLPQDTEKSMSESRLQALLLTDEPLSVLRVLDLCRQLPGIRACVLLQDTEVVATSSALSTDLDWELLCSETESLLKSICGSSAKMGLGATKAFTLFTPEGPLSFLQEESLCFLVLHKHPDRGFIPGVREKMQLILAELVQIQNSSFPAELI